jgi:hypothetical protein
MKTQSAQAVGVKTRIDAGGVHMNHNQAVVVEIQVD